MGELGWQLQILCVFPHKELKLFLSWYTIGNIKMCNLKSEFKDKEQRGQRHKAKSTFNWQHFQFAVAQSVVQPMKERKQCINYTMDLQFTENSILKIASDTDRAFTFHFYMKKHTTEPEHNDCFKQQTPFCSFQQTPIR